MAQDVGNTGGRSVRYWIGDQGMAPGQLAVDDVGLHSPGGVLALGLEDTKAVVFDSWILITAGFHVP